MLVRKLVITAFLFGISQASAAPIPDSPDRQTSWGLYVDSRGRLSS